MPTICPISAPTAGPEEDCYYPRCRSPRAPSSVTAGGYSTISWSVSGAPPGGQSHKFADSGGSFGLVRGGNAERRRERRPAEHRQALRVHDPLSGDAVWRDGHCVRGRCGEFAAVTASASSTSAAASSAASGMFGRDRQRRGREDRLPGRLRLHESERYGRDERSTAAAASSARSAAPAPPSGPPAPPVLTFVGPGGIP